ncbi:hypothetical protein V9T40_003537 [Parthenolecanium corni]|uniref:Uncharacterized protein n=1 Tax=Parthenolecanium corni TaxID=536013 RepID=A0AAN9TSW6_9HEMI
MVLTRSQRKRLQRMVDEATDSGLVESLHPSGEYVAPAKPKKARRTTMVQDSVLLPENSANDHSLQVEMYQLPVTTANASPEKPANPVGAIESVGAVGRFGAVVNGDYVSPAIGNFEFTHTMTYNTCSNLAANDVIATGDDARPSDLSKCTCYFRSLRSFIDLPPHFGYDANNRAGIWSLAPKRTTLAVAATSCLLMGVYCWQHGLPTGLGKALESSTAEAPPARKKSFWAIIYDYLIYAFYE